MNEVKKLNKQKLAKNVYRMIIESGQTIESVALRAISIIQCFNGKHPCVRVLFHFEQRFITKSFMWYYN